MISTQYIKLNMTPSGALPVLYCSQYDIGRPLGLVVHNGSEPVDLDTYTVTIEATRTDGTPITAAVTTDDNIGVFVTTAEMTNKEDKYFVKLVLFDSNSRRVASLAFVMVITPTTMDENAEPIQEDRSLYEQYTAAVQSLIAEIRADIADLQDEKIQRYDTVAQMKAAALKAGMYAQTGGYYAVNDGGGALYRIYSTAPATHYETLTNGLYAELITEETVCPEMFGAYGDGETDDTAALQASLTYAASHGCSFEGKGVYLVSDTITVTSTGKRCKVHFSGTIQSGITGKDRPVIVFENCTQWEIFADIQGISGDYYGGYTFDSAEEFKYGLLPYAAMVVKHANTCKIGVSARNFNVGLRLDGTGGTVYNLVQNINIWNCAYGLELYAPSGGWVNNNVFNADTISVNSGIANRAKSVPVHIWGAAGYANNCNYFEGDFMTESTTPVIVMESGAFNTFKLRGEDTVRVLFDEKLTVFNFVELAYLMNTCKLPGSNYGGGPFYTLIKSMQLVANVDADNVDLIASKTASSNYYALGSDLLQYMAYDTSTSTFKDWRYTYSLTDISKPSILNGIGIFADICNSGNIAIYVETVDESLDNRLRIYLLDKNKNAINPNDGYINSTFGGLLTKDVTNMRLVSGSKVTKSFQVANLSESVRYVFVTCSNSYKKLALWAKIVGGDIPKATSYSNDYKYPYFPIQSNVIKTTHPMVGKRLYSTVDGAEYVCTAVTDGVETWVKKAAT